MSRKSDLEQFIRESYELVYEYEEIIRVSSDPKERKRAEREIEEQRALIDGYLKEYQSLCGNRGYTMPTDVVEIAAGAKQADPQQDTNNEPAPSLTLPSLVATPPRGDSFRYHAFISYSQADQTWVQRELLPRLQEAGVNCIDQRQFKPGRPQLDEIERAIRESRRTLLILTPNYLEDDWRQCESAMVGSLGLEIGGWRAIPVIAQACDLPLRLHALVPIDLSTDEDCEWRRLIGALSPPQNVEQEAKRTEPLIIETVSIPAGFLWIGSEEKDIFAYDDEKPQHKLFLFAYRIGKYPVMNIQYQAFVKATQCLAPSHWKGDTVPPGQETHPVVNVSYDDAVAFCRWLSKVSGRYYRVPTEEEWEKAARGLDKRRYPWGDEWNSELCNTKETELGATTSVETYQEKGASPFGVADMSGNVAEWTCSWYGRYPNSPSPSIHFGRIQRVVRGGSWMHPARWARVSFRGHYPPEIRRPFLGFRVVLEEI